MSKCFCSEWLIDSSCRIENGGNSSDDKYWNTTQGEFATKTDHVL